MNRREFTRNMVKLIQMMIDDKNEPVIDYCLRSTEEQQRLFGAGYSKCDGLVKKSAHQSAKAFDLYFVLKTDDGVSIDFEYEKTRELAEKYHKIWVGMGGKPLIEWDCSHYGTE